MLYEQRRFLAADLEADEHAASEGRREFGVAAIDIGKKRSTAWGADQSRPAPGWMRVSSPSPRTCQWPLWETGARPDGRYCGAPSAIGRPYCPEHCRVAYVGITGLPYIPGVSEPRVSEPRLPKLAVQTTGRQRSAIRTAEAQPQRQIIPLDLCRNDAEHRIVALNNRNLSASEIGRLVGQSKHVVIGKLHRIAARAKK